MLLVLALAGCATTSLPPLSGTRLDLQEDEKRIWINAEEGEKQINRSGLVAADADFERYLGEVARKLFPDTPVAFRIRVLRDSGMNAFALPNGAIYLHTGLLARMENEAQLAALLGHELTHAVNRHGIRTMRDIKNKAAIFSAVTLGGYGSSLLTLASVTGYERDLEREADREGYRRMVDAGYEPSEAPRIFRILELWIRETGVKDPYFFSSHPKVLERIESFEALAAADPQRGKGVDNREVFVRRTATVVFENAMLDLKGGRYESALRGVDRCIAASPREARGHCLRGEILRRRNAGSDIDNAVVSYRQAVAVDAACAEAYRALGLIHFKRAEKEEARRMLEQYLRVSPGASDRAYVEGYLRSLR